MVSGPNDWTGNRSYDSRRRATVPSRQQIDQSCSHDAHDAPPKAPRKSLDNQPVDRLIELLLTGDDWHRRQAAIALSEMGPAAQKATPTLIITLDDENPQVRGAAGEVLAEIPWQGKPSPILIDALRDDDPMARGWAIAALGAMLDAPQWVIVQAIHLLTDPDWVVRVATGDAFLRLVQRRKYSRRLIVDE